MRSGVLLLVLAGCSGSSDAAFNPVELQFPDASSGGRDGAVDGGPSGADAQPNAVADASHDVTGDTRAHAADAADACKKRVCVPKGHCDLMDDGCGGKMDCGTCDPPNTCGAFRPNECSCIPKRCQDVANSCGAMPDSCNGTNNCPTCPALKGCGEGTTPFVCGTFYERCSTTNFPGSQCVLVNGSTTEHRFCTQALLNQYGAAHNCIGFGSAVCQVANGAWRCDF